MRSIRSDGVSVWIERQLYLTALRSSGVNDPGTAARWLLNGRQRQAVAKVLRQPLTVSHIWQLAREFAPKIQLRDVSYILRQFHERGLVQCLNPSLITGRIYYWTPAGRESAIAALGRPVDALPAGSNWNRVGQVSRAQARRSVLEAMGRAAPQGHCPSGIRRQLRETYPMELCRARRAVRELSSLKLIRPSRRTEEKKLRLYELTPAGRRVVEMLQRQHEDERDSAASKA